MKLTRKSFEAWLAAQPGYRRFNYTACSDCMIATWIKDTTEHEVVSVRPGSASLGPTRRLFEFPKWLTRIDDHASSIAVEPGYHFKVSDLRQAIRV